MLQKQTVEPRTFSVLERLMQLPELKKFCLVGGTALALKYGHRKSIDLDLFSQSEFDQQAIIDALAKTFQEHFTYDGAYSKWGIFCFIYNIKVDIVHYPHSWIRKSESIETIRLAHDEDLIAMKIQAILGRGEKKDFWDIAELLSHHKLEDMIKYHKKKYPNQMLGISIPQALIYFEDAEQSAQPISSLQTWEEIKATIKEKTNNYLK